jgi:hypothetical protein
MTEPNNVADFASGDTDVAEKVVWKALQLPLSGANSNFPADCFHKRPDTRRRSSANPVNR